MLRLVPLTLFLAACGGEPEPPAPEERPSCQQICQDRVLVPCRDNCDTACGDDDACRDLCQGDCLVGYEACVAETCD